MTSWFEADVEALQSMAHRFVGLAGQMRGELELPSGGALSCQVTAAVVRGVHTGVEVARATLATRVQNTAAAVSSSAESFAAHESHSAATLGAIDRW